MSYQNNDDRKSDLAVMDANEYDQKRRLKRLHDRLEEPYRRYIEAWNLYTNGRITYDALCIQTLQANKFLIQELWELGIEDRRSEHDPYWHNRNGEQGYDPEQIVGVLHMEHSQDIVFRDLCDILWAQDYYTETWTETEHRRHGADEKIERERDHVIPERLTTKAYLRIKEYLSDRHDMELKFELIDDERPYDDWREEFEDGVYEGPDSVTLPHENATE